MNRTRFPHRRRRSDARASDRPKASLSIANEVERLRMLSRISNAVAGEYDLEELLLTMLETAIQWSRAEIGTFTFGQQEICRLRTASGMAEIVGVDFAALRRTLTFAPTVPGSGVVRSGDVRRDARFEIKAPDFAQAKEIAPVVSYLAVPIIAGSEDWGAGFFLAHHEPSHFDEMAEETVKTLAALAATAIEKAGPVICTTGASDAQRKAVASAAQLAAIVEHSQDAILSKSLDGVIKSWNASAERLFGYSAEEAVGRSITLLIPQDRLHEEDMIISGIRAGRRTEHLETLRRRKDGALVHVSLSISPIRDERGEIVGASQIARDISERVETQERQVLLIREMGHRIKNVFALTNGLISLGACSAHSVEDFAKALSQRVIALAAAHALTMPDSGGGMGEPDILTSVIDLLKAILSPYEREPGGVQIVGDDALIGGTALTSLALVFHELATNAAKYGALSSPTGRLCVRLRREGALLHIRWEELGGPAVVSAPTRTGFGSRLETAALGGLGAVIQKEWKASGLRLIVTVPVKRLAA